MAHSLGNTNIAGWSTCIDSCIEKEVKILWIKYALLVRNLKKLWATKVWSVYIRDRYVQDAKQSKNQKKQQASVRLRSYGGEKFEVTIKSKMTKKGIFKTAQEDNISVPSLEAGKVLLEWLGYECAWYKEKIRISYTHDNVYFDIDFYDDMPPVLEIEWTEEQIRTYIDLLWLSNYKQKNRWARKLFKHYGKSVLKMEGSVMGIRM